MTAYYNENDPGAVAWLRELIKQGHIAPGDVDDRGIIDVNPSDLHGYTQHHFFAGIGGWSYAARLAGWPDSRPLWTGSPPCQPFSTAGKQRGIADERHLAPAWLALVKAFRPAIVAGEQVASAINKDNWLDDLLDALETEGYATGAIVLPACSVGAPHIRQRLWFVGRLADASSERLAGYSEQSAWQERKAIERGSRPGGMAKPDSARPQPRSSATEGTGYRHTAITASGTDQHGSARTVKTGWNDPDWIFCRDEKWRPVESGTFPLVDGVPARVVRLRGYGNAIVPQVAAQVLREVNY